MRTALAETERRMSKVTRVPDTRLFLTSGPRGDLCGAGSSRACCAGLHGWLLFSSASTSSSSLVG